MRECSVIDLFCGAGGMTHGFVQEGFNVIAGLDSDSSCKYAYEHNNQATFINEKVEEIDPTRLLALYPPNHIKILVGCAPCQPFSTYTNGLPKGEKWKLLAAFADIVDAIEPDVISMENVLNILTFNDGAVYQSFVRRLERKYHILPYNVYCPDYGIPQKRRRLVVLASKFGEVELVPKTHNPQNYRTVRDVISSLDPIEDGGCNEKDPLHRAARLTDINKRRIKQSKPGGTWRDWEAELVAACHKKASGASYASVYGRMQWDEPSPTMTTECQGFGNGRFGHPEQDRAISLREAAILQTFPLDYQFSEPGTQYSLRNIARHIGNAVPVELGRVVARSIAKHLEALA
ncbi:MAG: DNA cytosine methyltransferase [Chloroflexota bacterium]|nr:DNA cytosine methyltransferase [Chloroflexota bacterium]